MRPVLDYQQPAKAAASVIARATVSLLIALMCSAPSTGWIIPRILTRTLHLRAHLIPRILLVCISAAFALLVCTLIFATIGKDPLRRHARRLAKIALAFSIGNVVMIIAIPIALVMAMTWGWNLDAQKGMSDLSAQLGSAGIALPKNTQYVRGWSDDGWDGAWRFYLLRLPTQDIEVISKSIHDLPSDQWFPVTPPFFAGQRPSWWDDKKVARGESLRIHTSSGSRHVLHISLLRETSEIYLWLW